MSGPVNVYSDTETTAQTDFVFAYAGSISDGNFLVLVVDKYYPESISTPAGWTAAFSNAYSSQLRMGVFYKVASSESSPITITSGTARKWAGVLLEYADISGLRGGSMVQDSYDPLDTASLSTVTGDEIISGIGCAGNLTLGLDGSLSTAATVGVSASDGVQLKVGIKQATSTTTGPFTHTNSGASKNSLLFIMGLVPSAITGNEPTVIDDGSHDQTTVNGETGVSIDTSAWFDAQDGTPVATPYSLTTGSLTSLGWSLNATSGALTGTTETDASDNAPYSLGITFETDNGTVEALFTVDVDLQIIISGVPLKTCDGTTARSSTATTHYVIYNAVDVADFESASIIASGSDATIAVDGTLTLQVPNVDVAKGDAGCVILQDTTEGFASYPIPVTFT